MILESTYCLNSPELRCEDILEKPQSLIGCWQEVVDPCLHFNWCFLGGSGEPEDASEICGWKAQKQQKDVVVFLKFSVSGSYDLLRRKAGLRRWAPPEKELQWGPLLPRPAKSGRR